MPGAPPAVQRPDKPKEFFYLVDHLQGSLSKVMEMLDETAHFSVGLARSLAELAFHCRELSKECTEKNSISFLLSSVSGLPHRLPEQRQSCTSRKCVSRESLKHLCHAILWVMQMTDVALSDSGKTTMVLLKPQTSTSRWVAGQCTLETHSGEDEEQKALACGVQWLIESPWPCHWSDLPLESRLASKTLVHWMPPPFWVNSARLHWFLFVASPFPKISLKAHQRRGGVGFASLAILHLTPPCGNASSQTEPIGSMDLGIRLGLGCASSMHLDSWGITARVDDRPLFVQLALCLVGRRGLGLSWDVRVVQPPCKCRFCSGKCHAKMANQPPNWKVAKQSIGIKCGKRGCSLSTSTICPDFISECWFESLHGRRVLSGSHQETWWLQSPHISNPNDVSCRAIQNQKDWNL